MSRNAYLDRLCVWMRANDLDPADIPMDATIRVEGHPSGPKTITVEVMVRDANGEPVCDGRNRIARRDKTVLLKVAWEDVR